MDSQEKTRKIFQIMQDYRSRFNMMRRSMEAILQEYEQHVAELKIKEIRDSLHAKSPK